MLTTRTNIHRSKLPALGAIVTLPGLRYGRTNTRGPWLTLRRFIVDAYPMCDNVRPWSIGIHTVHLRALDNGERMQVAGHWCQD